MIPSGSPSINPSSSPSMIPSNSPSLIPSSSPSINSSSTPSINPSSSPSINPSSSSSINPSSSPSMIPSSSPSTMPSNSPSINPSSSPSINPSSSPSINPSSSPSTMPSNSPSMIPSSSLSMIPSNSPSINPSNSPTDLPCSPTTSCKIGSPEPQDGANFGYSVVIKDIYDLIVVGEVNYELNGLKIGRAHIFQRSTGDHLSDIKASVLTDGARFGASVDIADSKIIIGAPGGFNSNSLQSGVAYIFDIQGVYKNTIEPSDGADGDFFGHCVSIDS